MDAVAEKKLRGGIGDDSPLPLAKKPEPKKPVQEILNDLIFRYGKNVPSWPDWEEKLAGYDLSPRDILPGMLTTAQEQAREHLLPALQSRRLDWQPWIKEKWSDTEVVVWRSKCGLYKVARIPEQYGLPAYFAVTVKIHLRAAPERIIKTELRSLQKAFDVAEEYHQRLVGLVESNREEVLEDARKNGISRVAVLNEIFDNTNGKTNRSPEPNRENVMLVKEVDGRKLLVALKGDAWNKFPKAKVEAKLQNLKEVLEGECNILDNDELKELQESILKAKKVELEPEEGVKAESNGKTKGKKGKAAAKAESNGEAKRRGKKGVYTFLVDALKEASQKKPVTEEAAVKAIVENFPNRDEEWAKKYFKHSIAYYKMTKGTEVSSNGKGGYWL